MLSTNIPAKFTIPWAYAAGGSYIRQIPTNSQIGITNGAASLTDGFVPLNFQPVGAGGVPPFGQDANGILNWVTLWSQWQAAGGPVYYDSGFSASISGYPKGSVLQSTTLGKFWLNTSDGNTTNPDSGGSNWVSWYAGAQGIFIGSATAGTSTALTTTLSPAPNALTNGMSWRVLIGTVNGPAATINPNGLGAVPIVINANGSTTLGNELVAGEFADFIYDGISARLLNPAIQAFLATKSSNQTISLTTMTDVTWTGTAPNFASWDNTNLTFTKAGLYLVSTCISTNISTNNTGYVESDVHLYVNGSDAQACNWVGYYAPGTSAIGSPRISVLMTFNVGDVLKVRSIMTGTYATSCSILGEPWNYFQVAPYL
jgi:hypothetical protein